MSNGSTTTDRSVIDLDLTAEDERLVDEALARHGGDPVATLGLHHLPEATKAEMRRVMGFQA